MILDCSFRVLATSWLLFIPVLVTRAEAHTHLVLEDLHIGVRDGRRTFLHCILFANKKKRAPKPSLPSGKVEDFFPVKPQMLFIERTADQPVKLSVPTDTSEASNMFIAH